MSSSSVWLKIGTVIPPAPSKADIDAAYAYQNAKADPTADGWYGWAGGWGGYSGGGGWGGSPLWWASVQLFAAPVGQFFEDLDTTTQTNFGWYVSTVLADGETAAKLDAAFAGTAAPPVTVSDGTVSVDCGLAYLQSKTPLKVGGAGPTRLWAYTFTCLPAKKYRTRVKLRHAWTWREVMQDDYPPTGSPVTAGPTLYDPAEDNFYSYSFIATGTGVGPWDDYGYLSGFDVQFDSGTRFGQTLLAGSKGTYALGKARFWAFDEAAKLHGSQWGLYQDRIVFGGRTPAADLAGNMPAVIRATYHLPDGATQTIDHKPGDAGASGQELLQLLEVHSAASLAGQLAEYAKWERERRRHQQTVFTGLVPWAMTPIDVAVQFCLPIDGHQLPATVVYGGAYRYRYTASPPLANPAPPTNSVTVRFVRPTGPSDPNYLRPPAGALTRDGYGSSPAFGSAAYPDGHGHPEAYYFGDLPDGTYSVSPGSPWTPATDARTLVGGTNATLTFTVPPTP